MFLTLTDAMNYDFLYIAVMLKFMDNFSTLPKKLYAVLCWKTSVKTALH